MTLQFLQLSVIQSSKSNNFKKKTNLRTSTKKLKDEEK